MIRQIFGESMYTACRYLNIITTLESNRTRLSEETQIIRKMLQTVCTHINYNNPTLCLKSS